MYIFFLLLKFANANANEGDLNVVASERFAGIRPGSHGSFFLKAGKNKILTSSDGKMKISAQEIVYNGKSIRFSEIDIANPKRNEKQYIEIPEFSFLKFYPLSKSVSVEIDQVLDGAFIIKYHNDSYTFSSPEENEDSNLGFQSYFPPGSGQQDVNFVLAKNSDLQKFLGRVEDCAIKKNVECLKDLSSASLKDSLSSKITRRIIFDDSATCKIYNQKNNRNIEENVIPEGLAEKADQSKTKLWSHLKEAARLDNSTNYILFHGQGRFVAQSSVLTVIRNIVKKNSCNNYNDLQLELQKTNNDWKIVDLYLTDND